jgi:hypothetical protein
VREVSGHLSVKVRGINVDSLSTIIRLNFVVHCITFLIRVGPGYLCLLIFLIRVGPGYLCLLLFLIRVGPGYLCLLLFLIRVGPGYLCLLPFLIRVGPGYLCLLLFSVFFVQYYDYRFWLSCLGLLVSLLLSIVRLSYFFILSVPM